MKAYRLQTFFRIALFVALLTFTLSPLATPTASAQDGDGLLTSLEAVRTNSLRTADGRMMVMVELTDSPVVERVDVSTSGTGGVVSAPVIGANEAILSVQDAVVLEAEALGVASPEVLGRTTYLINTISLAINEKDLNALALSPGVKTVYPVIEHQLDLSGATTFTNTVPAWTSGYIGEGRVVAIVDTGIDYTNPDFGGNGSFPAGGPNSAPRLGTPSLGTFPLGAGTPLKVVGGYDYAGDSFTGSNTPVPDRNPLDCRASEGGGHGTHVAGISAGYGVSGSTTYPGPWDNTTPFGTLNPSPGYAPRAALLGMRVFGCSGSTTSVQVIAAINDAAAGFVATDPAVTFPAADVVNMSLGSQLGYGGDDATLNPYTGAIANAMATGTIIVMSAGNNSDTHFITGSPGSSPAGISVASIIHGNYNAITVGGTGANGNYPVQQSVSSPMVPPPVGPYPLAQPAGNGCLAADYSAFPTNSISIVTFTGGCGSAVLMASAQASPNTPRGLLVISNVPGQFQNLACSGGGPYIPCVSLQPATGTFLLANIATATVIMDASLRASAANLAGVASAFTSRGPSRQSSGGLKPDIASTGDGILSAASGQTAAPYSASNSGTSMSSPSVAGMIATILSNPTYNSWTPAQIKALIMNTATTVANVNDAFGNPNPMVRYGAGVANTFSAIQNQVIVYNTARPDVVSLTFGTVNAVMNGTATVRTADLTVRNLSSNTATYNVSWVGVSNQAGVTVTASPSSISVAPGATTTVTVTLTANFTGIATPHANTDPTRGSPPFLQVGNPRHWMSETTGYVSFSPTSGAAGVNQALRLNVYANARPASDMSAPDTLTSNTLSGTINIPLTGNSINSGAAYPNDIISMVTALRLMGEDPAGDTAFNAPWGDIRYVGVSNDANGNITGTRFVYFGISVEGELSTPQPQGFQAVIYFDYNGDDILDSCSFNTSPASGTSRTDVFINYLAPGCGSGFGQNWLNDYAASVADSYVFSNNVYVLPVRLSGAGTTLGRSNATPAFRFQIELYSEFELMDVFPNDGSWIDYNPNQPIYSFNSTGELDGNALQMPAYFDDASTTIPMTYDLSTFTGTTPPGILLFHHHNGTVTNRPEIILFGVTGAGGIQVTHSVPANVDVGALFNFTATVTNLGTTDALNVVLTDALPIAAAVQLQAPLPAGCTAAGQDVTCTVGTLAAGESRSFVFPVRGMGNYTVTALASATTTSQDLDPTDNTNIPATVTIGYGSGGTGTAGGPGTGPLSLPSTGYEPAPTSVDMAVLIGGIVAGLLLLGGVFVWRRRR